MGRHQHPPLPLERRHAAGFAYFYWVMNRDSLKDLDWAKLWMTESMSIEAVSSMRMSLTLVSMAVGKEPTITQLEDIRERRSPGKRTRWIR